MEFTFNTDYNFKTLTIMAKALRKTVRKKKSRNAHIFSYLVLLLGTFISFTSGFSPSASNIITWIAMLIILATLLFEDKINGYMAKKNMIKGTENAAATFNEDGFVSQTKASTTQWKYDKIETLVEDDNYFIFLFSNIHAQIYSKESIGGGTVDEFREFMEKAAGKKAIRIK